MKKSDISKHAKNLIRRYHVKILADTKEILFYENGIYVSNGEDLLHEILEKQITTISTAWSTRFMFSNTDEFVMADKYLKASPEAQDINRERLKEGIHKMKPEDFEGKVVHDKPKFWMDPRELDKLRDRDQSN